MQRIFITGATGFIGSNLVKHFTGLNNYLLFGHSREVKKARQQFQQYKIEMVSDYSALLLNELKIDYVIHLAGIAHDLSNHYKSEDYHRVNYENTKNVYDEFIRSNASCFIFLSSIKAVVDISEVPVTEEVAPNPFTDYGKSKLKAEQYIQSKVLAAGKHVYIFRPCMIHGPGNKGNLNLLYRFVKSRLPYPFGAFENQRSFLSLDNFTFIVQQFLEKEIPSGVYHLADEGYLSTKELYRVIAMALDRRQRILNIPKSWVTLLSGVLGKKHMLDKLTEDMMVSNEKLLKTLSTKLPVSLREGLIKTIKSFRG